MSVERKKGKNKVNRIQKISDIPVLFMNLNLSFILKLHIVYEYYCWRR